MSTYAILISKIHYDANTGVLCRINAAGDRRPYKKIPPMVMLKGSDVPVCDLVWWYVHGVYPDQPVYCIDGNSQNLMLSNLAMEPVDRHYSDDVVWSRRTKHWQALAWNGRELVVLSECGTPMQAEEVYSRWFNQLDSNLMKVVREKLKCDPRCFTEHFQQQH